MLCYVLLIHMKWCDVTLRHIASHRITSPDTLYTSLLSTTKWAYPNITYNVHSQGIFHRDVKPENILIESSADTGKGLKLADFGSCRGIYSKKPYTEYISTRWYRAPECLLTNGWVERRKGNDSSCTLTKSMYSFPSSTTKNKLCVVPKLFSYNIFSPSFFLLCHHSSSHLLLLFLLFVSFSSLFPFSFSSFFSFSFSSSLSISSSYSLSPSPSLFFFFDTQILWPWNGPLGCWMCHVWNHRTVSPLPWQ